MTEKTVRPRSVLRRTMLVGTAGVLGDAVLCPSPVRSQTGAERRNCITQAILDGRQPPDLTADKLLAHSRLPLAWQDQRTLLGFA